MLAAILLKVQQILLGQKQIIKLIWCLGEEIRKNPTISEKLSVIFLEDYRVTLSEMLMPAAEISEQISLAGKEASGTGCMKLMINGALTIGTLDGANVEMHQQVGDENIFLFGLTASEVVEKKEKGYAPYEYYMRNQDLKAERSNYVSLSAEYSNDIFSLSVSGFK